MRTALSLGAALGVHGLLYAALPAPEPAPAGPVALPLEVRAVVPVVEPPAPAAKAPGPPTRAAVGRARGKARKVAVSVPVAVAVAESGSVAVPVTEGTGEDAAALGEALRGAARETGGGGTGPAEEAAPAAESRRVSAAPVEDYTRLVPEYSDDAIDHDVTGAVALRLEVDEEGRVTRATVLKGRGYGLDELAVETAKRYRFRPALDDLGRPTKSVIGWRIVWDSYWKRLFVETIAGHPNCRGQGPLNLGEYHPVYIDCDAPAGLFALTPEELRGRP